jgi:hypothetical protein
VPDADVETVSRRFRDAVNASAVRNRIELDTSDATVEQSVREFAAAIEPYLTDEDRSGASAVTGP